MTPSNDDPIQCIQKGVIEGADFAPAYFAIWLGPRPISESLKSQMLAGP